jgi:aldose 1-epimerase
MSVIQTKVQAHFDKPIFTYELKNDSGTTVKITNIGATITGILAPDKKGNLEKVTLGFTDPLYYLSEKYLSNSPFLGATVGRYANRIALGEFQLNGKKYHLAKNNGANHLHGGPEGFFKKIWDSTIKEGKVVMTLLSPDMEEGYPGNVKVITTFSLTNDNELVIDYFATTDKATPLNLTNHTYFNLSGKKSQILNHELMIFADAYTPAVEAIPTGEIRPVKGTPFDFTEFHKLGERANQLDTEIYDHNYVLNGQEGELKRVAIARDPLSGRTLEAYTTMPGMQLYTGYYLDGSHQNEGQKIESLEGFCLETQYFPDSPNNANFPSAITTPDQPFKHTTVYKFGIDN